jgi:hypothetical protein
MLPGVGEGRADAVQGRCRAGRARAVLGPSPRRVFRVARTAPVGPTHAVDATTGACGIKTHGLEVLDQDWEEAFFVEKCPGCFTAVVAQS